MSTTPRQRQRCRSGSSGAAPFGARFALTLPVPLFVRVQQGSDEQAEEWEEWPGDHLEMRRLAPLLS